MGNTSLFYILDLYRTSPLIISVMDHFGFFVFATFSLLQGISSAQVKDCVSSCKGVPTGDYASCKGCEQYVTCMYGNLIGPRHCPKGTLFDSKMKRCDHEWKVQDCHVEKEQENSHAVPAGTVAPIAEESQCIESCKGMPMGNYQSCYTCSMYITCAPGHYPMLRPCPSGLVWNDNLKVCHWSSLTCSEKELRTTTAAPAPSTTDADEAGSGDGESGDGEINAIDGSW